jgi:hypothetical protein
MRPPLSLRPKYVAFLLDLQCGRGYSRVETGTATAVAAEPAAPTPGVQYLVGARIAGGRLEGTLVSVRALSRNRLDILRGTLRGTVTDSRAQGTLALGSRVIARGSGRTVQTCERTLRWRTVRDPGRVFGGNTSRGGPVVLRLSPDRRRVVRTWISWAAPCRGASTFYIEPHDRWLLPFRLGAGRSFRHRYRYDAGEGSSVVGRFGGSVRATVASGAFRSRLQGPRERCDTGALTWSAMTG